MKILLSLWASTLACCLLLSLPVQAQIKGKHAVFTNDLDGDGIPDTGGQDKCPTTIDKIQGRIATAVDELTDKQVIIRLPEDLKEYVFQDRVPIEEERKQELNEQASLKRERRRAEDKYGKYKDMKGKERKEKIDELTVKIDEYQVKIDSLNQALREVDPASYVQFTGDLLTEDGRLVKEKVTVKIRLRVDAFGCLQDDDGDGMPNMVDLCNGEMGPVETNGCPDKDGDGIPDKDDDCPTVQGPKFTNGCPDTDGDGIPDKNDDCPKEKGPKALNGCPDKDGDGIKDSEDDCPETPGIAKFKGCPDTDGDGIPDKEDECPEEAGIPELKGCPVRDRDEDGVPNDEDECPDVPGPVENKGCPKILEKASRVLFETGKAVIKPASYSLLDELVALLEEYPKAYISLIGHTDSQGGEDANLQLSKDRAAAVKAYLIKKGIDESRITSDGFGEMRPIASNESAEGRAKNRRVEMKLSNKPKE